jgi:hypothetical protein
MPPKSSNKKSFKPNHNSSTSFYTKLKYAIDNGDAKVEKKIIGRRRGLRSVVTIGDKSYTYNPNKITKILTTKLKQLTKTKQFEATLEIKRVYQSIRLRKSLKSYAGKFKAEIHDEPSMFKGYINSMTISNINLKYLNGLSYLKYQYDKLNSFLVKNPNMKILIVVSLRFDELDGGGEVVGEIVKEIRSRRYSIHNSNDLQDTLNNMAADIELQIENSELPKSGLRLKGIEKIHIHYDRYNPTRGGSFIPLPKWVADKKACINIKNEDNKCAKYSIQCGFYNVHEQKNPQEMRHYTKIDDKQLNWEGMKYPSGNRDFDRFEENNHDNISVNVYTIFEFEGKETIVLHRRTKIIGAKHHVNLLKIDGDKGKIHYV